ncbi:EAL domain-containing protein [Vogesella sp. LYT5W]|uniref:EAL domain-containing protein n=1 Tax=Vogesella margarita TaxID=2984199 RepID=A0ABT5IQU3_9NEIS|nr:EAL domain-containing protein [Vogesella margarita]MDC7714924.1 EAL domain-containing protein [Vogesella margarita]
MTGHPRNRFILIAIASYVVFGLLWILLSDHLLLLFADVDALTRLSTAKGVFFVIATAALFFFLLRAVPQRDAMPRESLLGALTFSIDRERRPHWFLYLFAVVITAAVLLLRLTIPVDLGTRPMLILFMLPIVLCALLGGLGPGLFATLLTAAATDLMAVPHFHSATASAYAQLQWASLVLNGLGVSLLSAMLHRSLAKQEVNRRMLDVVVSGNTDAVFVKDAQGSYLLANAAAAAFVGKPVQDIIGQDDRTLFDAASAQALIRKDRDIMAAGMVQTSEEQLTLPDGKAMVFLVTKGPMSDGKGRVNGLFGIARDITERKRVELALKEAAVVFDSSYEGIMVVSPAGRITKVNAAFTRITGYSAEAAVGQTPALLSSGQHDAAFYREMWASVREHGFWHGEIWNRRQNGELYPEQLSISVVHDEQGQVCHYVGIFSDISQLKAHEAELERIANFDPLTGLPNRRLLSDRLEQAIRHSTRSGKSCAVCFLDLDGFKAINDQYGHAAGDQLLIGVSANLKTVLRADDTLARLGGDEFVVLLVDVGGSEECVQVLERLLAAIRQEVDLGDTVVRASASIGVSLYPQDNVDADTLLRHADQAMYLAKDAGKNRYRMFDPESDRKSQEQRKELEQLRHALANDEFVLYYQPKVSLDSGDIIGAEALIRWCHPERGLVPPGAFLPLLHGTELENAVDEWVINTALAQASAWHDAGLSMRVSVNVSAGYLLAPTFYSDLARALQCHTNVPPEHLELEVLETAAIADMGQAVAIMQRCRKLGVRFALDDFGTGYSSLTYLRKLPVDTLKIDQSFVRDMLNDADDLGIVEGVIQLATVFERQVIAEGVETLQHGAVLRRLGCHLVQGYGIARPLAAEAFPSWCRQWQTDAAWHTLGEAS